MISTISIITAVHPPHMHFLTDAYKSLRTQILPNEWQWQWCIQFDGNDHSLNKLPFSDDPNVHIRSGTKGGPAIARNLATASSTGSLLKVLDADDQLLPDVLYRDIAILAAHSDIGWTTSSVLDLNNDGSITTWTHADPSEGILSQEEVLTYFQRNHYRLPVHPATLCIRKDIALALGGWTALPGGEDTDLLLAASVTTKGYFNATPGLLYRKHPNQMTARIDWTNTSEWHTRMHFTEARAIALRALRSTT